MNKETNITEILLLEFVEFCYLKVGKMSILNLKNTFICNLLALLLPIRLPMNSEINI